MKSKLAFAIAALALSVSAHSQIVASMPNEAGGKIVLSLNTAGTQCKFGVAMSVGGNGQAPLFGCFIFNTELEVISIKWSDREYRTYSLEAFTWKKPDATAQRNSAPAISRGTLSF